MLDNDPNIHKSNTSIAREEVCFFAVRVEMFHGGQVLRKHMKCTYLMFVHTNYYRLSLANNRPDLSSERSPHRDKKATFRQKPSNGK
jgi:hypothetical protein